MQSSPGSRLRSIQTARLASVEPRMIVGLGRCGAFARRRDARPGRRRIVAGRSGRCAAVCAGHGWVLPRRRHRAVIVPIDGPSTAVVEADELQTPPAVDTMVISADVMAAAAEAVAAGLGAGQAARVGVLGGKAIPAAWWAMLEDVVQARSP
jgi:hypothetical protein